MTDSHPPVPGALPAADLGSDLHSDLDVVRAHAEVAYAHELAALDRLDDRPRPPQWRLSPWAVVTYLIGGTLADGTVVSRSTSVPAAWWRSPWPRWPPTGRCCCSACPARPRPG
jgi:hypothetical protein